MKLIDRLRSKDPFSLRTKLILSFIVIIFVGGSGTTILGTRLVANTLMDEYPVDTYLPAPHAAKVNFGSDVVCLAINADRPSFRRTLYRRVQHNHAVEFQREHLRCTQETSLWKPYA